eukprot:3772783-Pyramimonas_sp.AAC.1
MGPHGPRQSAEPTSNPQRQSRGGGEGQQLVGRQSDAGLIPKRVEKVVGSFPKHLHNVFWTSMGADRIIVNVGSQVHIAVALEKL